ncbi:MAG: ECF transporter S component [Chloroflexota bacterium]|nr:ECF transporter S component [Chloroflexota bacterium]
MNPPVINPQPTRGTLRASAIYNPQSVTISPLLLLLTSAVGLGAFFYPFFLPPAQVEETGSHAADAPLLLVLLIGLCLVVLLADLETRRLDARQVALLGILVATNAALRPLPGPSGFSAIFVLPILGGYVFGGGFGFLLGALSLLVSALFTAGVGPWLPFQMYALGWVGLSAGWLARPLARAGRRVERAALMAWGLVVGLAYGALMNLWFWPFTAPSAAADPTTAWDPAAGLLGTFQRYLGFYLLTSLPTDVLRGLGNAALFGLLALPLLKLLRRFRARFQYGVVHET